MTKPIALGASLKGKPRSARLYKRIQQELGFLFDSGFYLIHCEDGDSFDWCSVVLQGEACQIEFSVDRGSLGCSLGPVNGYRNLGIHNHRDWFYIYDVVNFIDQTPFDKYESNFLDIDHRIYKKDWMGWTLKRFSVALKPRLERILDFFTVEKIKRQDLVDYIEGMRRYQNDQDFKKRFSDIRVQDFNNTAEGFLGKRLLNVIVVIFVCLVIFAFLFLLISTYQILAI